MTGPTVVPSETRTLITGITEGWDSASATLRLWHRDGDGWRPDGTPWSGVLGHAGAAWGRGLHGDGAPAGHAGPVKAEGDGRSPAGAFGLRGAYGYAAASPGGALPYTPVDASWHCVDDPASRQYGRIVDARTVAMDWSSSEPMRRSDALYTWVVDIAHNPGAVRGGGSCIFFHVWHGPKAGTAGCTAMPRPAIERLIAALDPADRPVYVLLPREEYAALAPAWHLPPPDAAPAK